MGEVTQKLAPGKLSEHSSKIFSPYLAIQATLSRTNKSTVRVKLLFIKSKLATRSPFP